MVKSTFLDNWDYLSQSEKDEIERFKHDEYYNKVYRLGERAEMRGLVFPGCEIVDSFPPKEDLDWEGYGMDFGYTNDPTTLMRVGKKGDYIYIQELLYQKGLQNNEINKVLIQEELDKRKDLIVADSSEPKTIDDLALYGWNIVPAVKCRRS